MTIQQKNILGILGITFFLIILVLGFCTGIYYISGDGKLICEIKVSDKEYLRINYSGFNIDAPPSHVTRFSRDEKRSWTYRDISVLTSEVREELGITKEMLKEPNQAYCERIAERLKSGNIPKHDPIIRYSPTPTKTVTPTENFLNGL